MPSGEVLIHEGIKAKGIREIINDFFKPYFKRQPK
jgi:hypothetical protein